MTETGTNSDFAITGRGFFAVKAEDGKTYYTRNGSFQFGLGPNGIQLATSEGYPILDTAGNAITVPATYNAANITVNTSGQLFYTNPDGTSTPLNKTIGVYQFSNPSGLLKLSDSLYQVSDASGAAINESTNANVVKSKVVQGFLEGSNVEVANEMVNLIVAQRAYEMNSKAIQTADDMMKQANNLR